MSRARIVAALILPLILIVGYAAERSGPSQAGPAISEAGRPGAIPILPQDPEVDGMTDGPWAMYQPPRASRPRLRSYAACVVDGQAGTVLYSRRGDEVRPIASIVKLLTALVFLESGGNLEQEIEITPDDARNAGKSILWKGHRFKARDVLYAALMSSENRAARALARSTPYTEKQFIERMQIRAREIGCNTLHVVEPTGLSELNVASPVDVARLLAAALANPTIARVCRTYRHQFKALNARKTYRLTNSNRLLVSRYKVVGGKTGYIVEAGWCIANMIDTRRGPLVTVVMGARNNSARFAESRRLIDWALQHRERTETFALAS